MYRGMFYRDLTVYVITLIKEPSVVLRLIEQLVVATGLTGTVGIVTGFILSLVVEYLLHW